MRAYWRPGATPFERLEGYLAARLRTQEKVGRGIAALLAAVTGQGPGREQDFQQVLHPSNIEHPAEALGIARAVLFLCGVSSRGDERLIGEPDIDLKRLLSGELLHPSPASPGIYATPELVDGYCYMGASFARGVDRLFLAATSQPFGEHLHRALSLVGSAA